VIDQMRILKRQTERFKAESDLLVFELSERVLELETILCKKQLELTDLHKRNEFLELLLRSGAGQLPPEALQKSSESVSESDRHTALDLIANKTPVKSVTMTCKQLLRKYLGKEVIPSALSESKNQPSNSSQSEISHRLSLTEINTVIVVGEENRIATAGEDFVISLWRFSEENQKSLIKSFRGHEDTITRLVYVDSLNALVSGSSDGTIRFWSINDDRTHAVYAHEDTIWDIKRNQNNLLTCGADNKVVIWGFCEDFSLIKEAVCQFESPSAVEWIDNDSVFIGGLTGECCIFDFKKSKREEISGHSGVTCIVSNATSVFIGLKNGSLKVLQKRNWITTTYNFSDEAITSIAVSEKFLVIGTFSGFIQVTSVETPHKTILQVKKDEPIRSLACSSGVFIYSAMCSGNVNILKLLFASS
jgi:WD40 repeat protein